MCRTSFLQALNESGMLDELEGLSNITVLAPSNHAWDSAAQRIRASTPPTTSNTTQSSVDFDDGADQRNATMEMLRSVLRLHVIDGAFYPTDFRQGAALPLKFDSSSNVSVSALGETLTFNGSRAIKKGILLRNGQQPNHTRTRSPPPCSIPADP